jgi:hypothetical protein
MLIYVTVDKIFISFLRDPCKYLNLLAESVLAPNKTKYHE